MIRRKSDQGFDWITLSIYFGLMTIGFLSLYSVLYDSENPYTFLNINTQIGKYSIIVIVSLLSLLLTYVIDWKFWSSFAYPIYFLSILSLIAVLIFGENIKGARSWFNFLGFSFQPSEFAKFGTALAISSFLAYFKNDLSNYNTILKALGIIFLPVFLILLQPDAGSAMIFISLFILLYRAGFNKLFYLITAILGSTFIGTLLYNPIFISLISLNLGVFIYIFFYTNDRRYLILFFAIAALSIFLYNAIPPVYIVVFLSLGLIGFSILHWIKNRVKSIVLIPTTLLTIIFLSFITNYTFNNILKPHQQDRLNVWLHPEKSDPRGALYNVLQSKAAIGSGGVSGKGFLEGTMTHLNFVPEQSTDFIFSSIGEEQGFIGTVSVIILFLLLFLRLIVIAERGKTPFVTYYSYALAGYLFLHFFMNIGMNMGLVPVIGIPLPFISKGGSSLIIFSMMIGALLRMDAERKAR